MDKPNIQLSGEDGNAFSMISKASRLIKLWNKDNQDRKEVLIDKQEFEKEAMSGDYDHVIQTIMKYFNVS
jgi:hypothetical protein